MRSEGGTTMCKRHSFLLDREGRIYDGRGLTHSHTEIATMHGFESERHDALNAYEWQPPKDWPKSSFLDGLTVDRQSFEPKSSHDKALEKYLLAKFPTKAEWDAPERIDPALDGQTVTLACGPFTVYCTGVHKVKDGVIRASGSATVRAYGSATVEAFDSATVEAFDSATVEAFDSATVEASDSATVRASGSATVEASGSATVRASDSATVEAYGSATVEAYGSATVEAYDSATVRAYGSATVEAYDSATLILGESWIERVTAQAFGNAVVVDRKGGIVTVYAAVPVEVVEV